MSPRPLRSIPLLSLLCLGLLAARAADPAPKADTPLQALLVGGGPNPAHNQVAIESNVRYIRRLLPAGSRSRVLFADGDPATEDVLYQDAQGKELFRKTNLPALDGPTNLAAFETEFQTLRSRAPAPLLLYFTGHGSPGRDGTYSNNAYDMWNGETLSVKKLAGEIDTLPPATPVTLVMVQCFSGAFGNLIFQGGDPANPPTDKDLCGFFASVPNLPAAGCTSEVNEAEYHDFTSYFLAALSGTDRLGRPITGADYDHNGRVGMNEAFAYTLIHDISIDTPVCTSDVFLRRYATTPEAAVFQNDYSPVLGWAAPAQRAAMEALSKQLNLTGEGRLQTAYRRFHMLRLGGGEEEEASNARWIRFVRVAKSVTLAHEITQTGSAEVKRRFARLLTAEARNPLLSSRQARGSDSRPQGVILVSASEDARARAKQHQQESGPCR